MHGIHFHVVPNPFFAPQLAETDFSVARVAFSDDVWLDYNDCAVTVAATAAEHRKIARRKKWQWVIYDGTNQWAEALSMGQKEITTIQWTSA